MKILVAVDGSPYTKRMLAYLAAHDEWLGPAHRYTFIHSVLAISHRAAAFVGASVVTQLHEEDAELVFKPIREFIAGKGIEASFVFTVGHAAESIAKTAEDGAFDLIMMGASGHGELMNLVLGSVANKVLAIGTIPVLLIR